MGSFSCFLYRQTCFYNSMIKMDSEKECPFDMLFKVSVPHVPEKILFSLDYESIKRCLKVNKEWNKLLMSKASQRKAASIFREEALREGEELLRLKIKVAFIIKWLRELIILALILLSLYSVYYLLINWIMPHEDARWSFEYALQNAKSKVAMELALSNLEASKERQRLREASLLAPMVIFLLPIVIYLFTPMICLVIGLMVRDDMDTKEHAAFRLKAVPILSQGIFGRHYKRRIEALHNVFLQVDAKDLAEMYFFLRWASLFSVLLMNAIFLFSINLAHFLNERSA